MKRFTCLFLVLLLALSGISIAEAAEQNSWDFPQWGLTMRVPEDFKDLKGQILPYGPIDLPIELPLDLPLNIHFFIMYYLPITYEEYVAANEQEHEDDSSLDLSDLLVPYITLFIVENNFQNSLMSMLFNDLGEADLYGAGLDKAESGETDFRPCPSDSCER